MTAAPPSPPEPRWFALLVAGPEAAAIAMVAAAVTLWEVPTRGGAAVDAAPFGLALGYFATLAGRLIVGALRLPAERFGGLPTALLVGFLACNTLLLVAALALPLPLTADAALIAAGLVAWALRDGPRGRAQAPAGGLACVALSLAAATLWSVDSLSPTSAAGGVVVFKPWSDSYTHACFIRVFRDIHGVGSLEHYSMAGERAPFYHYACFLAPALLAATSGASCFLAYATFLVPFGVALSGLAAYALGRWWFGPGAGLAAAAGVLLVPDASRYGIANPYLGYHWLSQTGPTWLYGIAMIAVAWVLVFEGSRSGRFGLVAAGFVAAGASVAYKAHLFVAVAFLVWVYPAAFFRGVARPARVGWVVAAVATFALCVVASWRVRDVPLLKLDGSGRKPYLEALARNQDDPMWKHLLQVDKGTTAAHDLAVGVAHVAGGTLGALALAAPALAVLLVVGRRDVGLDRRSRAEVALFPALVTANYLVMALGLALDDRTQHMPDELLHRPLVWAYFAVAAWTAACGFDLLLRPRLGRLGLARRAAPLAMVALLGVPLVLGPGVQVGPRWGRDYTSLRVPAGFVRCAEFLRTHAGRDEVVQNSDLDTWNMLGALAERRVYVANTWRVAGKQTNEKIEGRNREITKFRHLITAQAVLEYAAKRRITWFVLGPDDRVRWPASLLDRPAFEAGDYRVYHFPPPG